MVPSFECFTDCWRIFVPRCFLACLLFASITTSAVAQKTEYHPPIADASNEGRLAMQGFQLPEGMTVELVAAEPHLANPVAFCIDERGRFYIAETYRQKKGVEDNRSHMTWLNDDLQLKSVDERLAMFRKHLGEKVNEYAVHHDRIRLLTDTNGDGKVDNAKVFADGFNGIVEGTGAGVLARGGRVFYTCIPHVWAIDDKDGDGVADSRTSFGNGFGVRVAFRGHDMHGLCLGSDGRLYFSIGDRGYNVRTKEGKHLFRPDTGAVFRCELDGSNLEEFAYGMRNPQELAFDDYGNLFTADNNSDSGDQARWVYVVEGGDTGWRMYYQYLNDRGPWNRERMWYPHRADEKTTAVQPAHIVPPIINIADGPSGLTYYPGVGLPDRYKGHFFLADFRGQSSNSGIRSFAVKPKGASFELVDSHQFLWKMLPTDVEFGYDGCLYTTDWVSGWDGLGKGRLYRFRDDKHAGEADKHNVAKLMAQGFAHRSIDDLIKLLGHQDRRIRQEAQLALAMKPAHTGKDVDPILNAAHLALNFAPQRIETRHLLWANWHRHRLGKVKGLVGILFGDAFNHPGSEIQAQLFRVMADMFRQSGVNRQTLDLEQADVAAIAQYLAEQLTENPSQRAQYFAARAIGAIGSNKSLPGLMQAIEKNKGQDPVLRHGFVMAMTGIGRKHRAAVIEASRSTSKSVRLVALLAMRRLGLREVSQFLNDGEPQLAVEAARAIHDELIESELPKLAALAHQTDLSDALFRRVLNANFRLGREENLRRVARIAANSEVPDALRLEAIEELRQWNKPSPIDRVLGMYRSIPDRKLKNIAELVTPALGGIFSGSAALRKAGTQLAADLKIKDAAQELERIARTTKSPQLQVDAMHALHTIGVNSVVELAMVKVTAPDAIVRSAARDIMAKRNPELAIPLLADAIANGETTEQQSAIATLTELKSDAADSLLGKSIGGLVKGTAPAPIQLDLILAAKKRGTNSLAAMVALFDAKRPKDHPLANYIECLEGGNADRGNAIFFGRSDASCRRCHLVNGSGGNVGPDLSAIGKDKKRDYLLEAIVLPNKQIAKGFETVILATIEGKVHVGVVKEDDGKRLKLMKSDGSIVFIDKDDIDDQSRGKSGMPEDLVKKLTKSEIRDLVAYLATLKTAASASEKGHD